MESQTLLFVHLPFHLVLSIYLYAVMRGYNWIATEERESPHMQQQQQRVIRILLLLLCLFLLLIFLNLLRLLFPPLRQLPHLWRPSFFFLTPDLLSALKKENNLIIAWINRERNRRAEKKKLNQ